MTNYSFDQLQALLLKVCEDLENARISFEVPDYLQEFWTTHRQTYYSNIAKEERRQQYLKLHEEFKSEFNGEMMYGPKS